LAVATGAAAEMRRSLGTAVLFGMLGVNGGPLTSDDLSSLSEVYSELPSFG
jgi:hypothetical protein